MGVLQVGHTGVSEGDINPDLLRDKQDDPVVTVAGDEHELPAGGVFLCVLDRYIGDDVAVGHLLNIGERVTRLDQDEWAMKVRVIVLAVSDGIEAVGDQVSQLVVSKISVRGQWDWDGLPQVFRWRWDGVSR